MWSTDSCQFERKRKQISLEVHDDDDDGDDYHRPSDLSDSDRRFSLNHRRSASPVANGLDSTYSSSEVMYRHCGEWKIKEGFGRGKLNIRAIRAIC
ncbi:hypothetical protein Hanom_Chr06g00572041 [Helianthus anomalus]